MLVTQINNDKTKKNQVGILEMKKSYIKNSLDAINSGITRAKERLCEPEKTGLRKSFRRGVNNEGKESRE